MTSESYDRPARPARTITCSRCGHVTPYLAGFMLKAVVHHLVAVHGDRMSLLRRG